MTLSAAGEDNGLLERTGELAALERPLAKARDGRGSLVLVSGEAGIGKTALVRAFCDAHRGGARVLWGVCDPLFSPRPLGPLLTVRSGSVSFRHELARQALDAAIDEPGKVRLHRAVLVALAAPPSGVPDLARLAHHADAAEDDDAVLRSAPAAAARACAGLETDVPVTPDDPYALEMAGGQGRNQTSSDPASLHVPRNPWQTPAIWLGARARPVYSRFRLALQQERPRRSTLPGHSSAI